MTRWIVTIRDGKTIDKLEMFVNADTADGAEEIGEQIIAAVDVTAYIDGITEAA